MAKTEWGKKHACTSCDAKFYDMKKDPAICPICGTAVSQRPLLKARRTPTVKPVVKPEPTSENLEDAEFPEDIEDVEIDEEDVEMDDAGDEALLVDEEMDEDVSEVADHIDSNNEKN